MKQNVNDLTGKRFGRLTVIKDTGKRKHRNVVWLCKCDCGNFKEIKAEHLRYERTVSCGCFNREQASVRGKNIAEKKIYETDLVEDTRLGLLTQKISKRNTSGFKGVSWSTRDKRWLSYIRFQKKRHYLGSFTNKQDAINARKEAEKKYFKPILEKYNKKATDGNQ